MSEKFKTTGLFTAMIGMLGPSSGSFGLMNTSEEVRQYG